MMVDKANKAIHRRIIRAFKFDKSVYEEVVDDSEATRQAILVPLLMEIAMLSIIVIAAIPLATVTDNGCLACITMEIAAGYGIFIVFLFILFLMWVPLLFAVGRFAGVKELRVKQVLRVMGFASSPLFLLTFFIVATMYSTAIAGPVASAPIFWAGIVIVATLLLINSVIAFRAATGVTTGVSVMSNFFALVIFGLISAGLVVLLGLALLESLKRLL